LIDCIHGDDFHHDDDVDDSKARPTSLRLGGVEGRRVAHQSSLICVFPPSTTTPHPNVTVNGLADLVGLFAIVMVFIDHQFVVRTGACTHGFPTILFSGV